MEEINHSVKTILSLTAIVVLKMNALFLTTDHLQNAYVVTTGNSLMKLDSTGEQVAIYNQNQYGRLTAVDASNPMKILLSFPDYSTLVYLDNTLSEVGTISLRNAGIYNYSACCYASSDNNTWVFDTKDYRLKKIDRNQKVLFESSDMFSLLGFAIHPVYMLEAQQMVYLADPKVGIIVFDVYGAYAYTIPVQQVTQFQIKNDQLFYSTDHSFHSLHLKTQEEKEYELPDFLDFWYARIERNRIYTLTEDSVGIYGY